MLRALRSGSFVRGAGRYGNVPDNCILRNIFVQVVALGFALLDRLPGTGLPGLAA